MFGWVFIVVALMYLVWWINCVRSAGEVEPTKKQNEEVNLVDESTSNALQAKSRQPDNTECDDEIMPFPLNEMIPAGSVPTVRQRVPSSYPLFSLISNRQSPLPLRAAGGCYQPLPCPHSTLGRR